MNSVILASASVTLSRELLVHDGRVRDNSFSLPRQHYPITAEAPHGKEKDYTGEETNLPDNYSGPKLSSNNY